MDSCAEPLYLFVYTMINVEFKMFLFERIKKIMFQAGYTRSAIEHGLMKNYRSLICCFC